VLRALETLAFSARECCRRAVRWLQEVQNPDGGFGESNASYYDPGLKGKGASTASQKAWGFIG
jgi:squalene-hopene/tetraprenyl-beta-curcumene cyclase